MKKNINITNATTIEAYGVHTNGNCKKVYCIEKKKAYTSMTDAALDLGCSLDAVSNVIRGKQKTCNGYHLIDLSKAGEAFAMIVEHLPNIDELRAKATAYDKIVAEEEAKRREEERQRKEKEKYEAEVAKAKAKIERRRKICNNLKQQFNSALNRLVKAEQEYEELTGMSYEEEKGEVAA